jgi:hypothetical protein
MYLEDFLGSQATQIAGSPIFIGLLVLAFFSALVLLRDVRLEVKVLGIGGGSILALAFLPSWSAILLGLGGALVLYLALMKVVSR